MSWEWTGQSRAYSFTLVIWLLVCFYPDSVLTFCDGEASYRLHLLHVKVEKEWNGNKRDTIQREIALPICVLKDIIVNFMNDI